MPRMNQFENHEVPLMPIVERILNNNYERLIEQFAKDKPDKFQINVWPLEGNFNSARISFSAGGKHSIAGFELEQMPGCCAIGTTSYLHGREKDYDFLTELREVIAKEAKWGILVATLTDGQFDQNRILERRGWVRGYRNFPNPKTGNGINIWVKDFTK